MVATVKFFILLVASVALVEKFTTQRFYALGLGLGLTD